MERIEPARFAGEVSHRFEFPIDPYGMDGPEIDDLLLPAVFYACPELRVAVILDASLDQPLA